jgi:hypothetical protein
VVVSRRALLICLVCAPGLAVGSCDEGESADGRSATGAEADQTTVRVIRDCADRVEGDGPSKPPGRTDLVIGPVAFANLKRAASESAEYFEPRAGRRFAIWKAAASVRANERVTASIPGRYRRVARLDYPAPGQAAHQPTARITFIACPSDEPAFSYEGPVGRRTGFAGGFLVAGARCVPLNIRVAGREHPIRARVPFGVRDC